MGDEKTLDTTNVQSSIAALMLLSCPLASQFNWKTNSLASLGITVLFIIFQILTRKYLQASLSTVCISMLAVSISLFLYIADERRHESHLGSIPFINEDVESGLFSSEQEDPVSDEPQEIVPYDQIIYRSAEAEEIVGNLISTSKNLNESEIGLL
jgi:hypothetical protein